MSFFERQPANDIVETGNDGKLTGKITDFWSRFFRALTDAIETAPKLVGRVVLSGATALHASVAPSVVPIQAFAAGDYLVHFYMRVQVPGGVSGDVTLTFAWPDGGVACTKPIPIMNGNTIGTLVSGTFPVHVDGGGPISYSTAYNAVPANTMQHSLIVRIEQLP